MIDALAYLEQNNYLYHNKFNLKKAEEMPAEQFAAYSEEVIYVDCQTDNTVETIIRQVKER